MGAKQSKAVSNNSTNITEVSKNTLNLLNEQINDVTANAMIQNSSAAVSTTKISQDLNFEGCKVKGDINITGGGQDAKAVVNFDAIEVSKVENEIAQEMLDSITSKIKNNLSSNTVAAMDAAAKASLNSGFNPFKDKVDTKTDNKFNLNIEQDNTQNIQNIVKQAINTNFDVEQSQKCVDEQSVEQKVDFKDCSALNINITNYTQEASVENLGKCMLQQGIANTVINKAASNMGIETVSEAKIEAKVKQESKSESTLVADLFSPIGFGISGLSSCLLVCCVLIIFLSVLNDPDAKQAVITAAMAGGGIEKSIGASVLCLVCLGIIGLVGYYIYEEVHKK